MFRVPYVDSLLVVDSFFEHIASLDSDLFNLIRISKLNHQSSDHRKSTDIHLKLSKSMYTVWGISFTVYSHVKNYSEARVQ